MTLKFKTFVFPFSFVVFDSLGGDRVSSRFSTVNLWIFTDFHSFFFILSSVWLLFFSLATLNLMVWWHGWTNKYRIQIDHHHLNGSFLELLQKCRQAVQHCWFYCCLMLELSFVSSSSWSVYLNKNPSIWQLDINPLNETFVS